MTNIFPTPEEVDHLIRNAQLRDELEPYLDESLSLLDRRRMSTPQENEFLASMLAWERAPVLSLGEWLTPPLVLPSPDQLDDPNLHQLLWDTVHRLADAQVVLEFTDHLSDRQLYTILYRDILPSPEKKIDMPGRYLHWHCLDADLDPETWLRYYATDRQREEWLVENPYESLPTAETPPHRRKLPRPT